MKKKIAQCIQDIQYVSERVLKIILSLHDQSITIISAYAPKSTSEIAKKTVFMMNSIKQLQQYRPIRRYSFVLILMLELVNLPKLIKNGKKYWVILELAIQMKMGYCY